MKAKQGDVVETNWEAVVGGIMPPLPHRSSSPESVNKLGVCQRGIKVTDGIKVVCEKDVTGLSLVPER